MKKTTLYSLVVCIALIPILVLISSFVRATSQERDSYSLITEELEEGFSLPSQDFLPDAEKFIQVLTDATLSSGVNIYKAWVGYDENNQPFHDYFILMSQNNSRLYDYIPLRSGQYLTSAQTIQGVAYLSTRHTDDPNQVGVIESLSNLNYVNIFPLAQIVNHTTVSGSWALDCSEGIQCERFRKILEGALSKSGYDGIRVLPLIIGGGWSNLDEDQFQLTQGLINSANYSILILLIIVGFIVCYVQVQDSKKFGKLKIIGKNIWQIWFDTTGKIVLLTTGISTLLCIAISLLIPYTTGSFVFSSFFTLMLVASISIIVSMVTLPYLYFRSVSDSIKNRNDSLWLVMLISFTKLGLTGFLLFFGISATNNYFEAQKISESFIDWLATFNYGGLTTATREGEGETFSKKWQETEYLMLTDLYQALNEKDAIYVNTSAYSIANMEVESPEGSYRSMKINPNYLEEFSILDQSGNRVKIEETETDWLVLVPEYYKNQETTISEFFQFRRTGTPDNNHALSQIAFFGVDPPERFYTQKIKILWIQSNQEIFSANTDVFPENQGLILDPIVEVMTLENSLANDRFGAIGNAASALKIKLINRDPLKTYEDLVPILKDLKLEDKISGVELPSDSIPIAIEFTESEMRENLFNMFLIFLLFLFLAFVSVLIFFSYEDKTVAVQKLLGYGLFRRHWHYLVVLGGNWGLITLVFATGLFDRVFHTGLINEWSLASYLPMLVFFVVEVIVSGLFFLLVERFKVANVLKGA